MSLQDKFNQYARKPDQKKLDRALQPPIDNTVENLHGYQVPDPFRPLENLTDTATTEWADRQDKAFADFIQPAKSAADAAFTFMQNAEPTGTRTTMPLKAGSAWTFWRKAPGDEDTSLWIKDTLEEGAAERCLLDPKMIDPTGRTKIANTWMTDDGKTLAYALSVSGSDSRTLKFMDVATGQDTGLVYNDFRRSVLWDKDGQGFHYSRFKDDDSKSTDVLYHKMGDDPSADTIIYSPQTAETGCSWFVLEKDSTDAYGAHEWMHVYSPEKPDSATLLIRPIGSDAAFTELFPASDDGELSPFAEINGRIYATTTVGSGQGRIVSVDPADPAPEKWQTLVPESEDPLAGAFVWQNKIFATYSHDTGSQIKVFGLDGAYLHDVPVPPLSDASLMRVYNDSKTCYMSLSNFQEAGNVYAYDSDSNQLSLFKKSISPIDLKDCIVERVYATSKDGTQVPMSVIRHPDTKLDGTAATLLYGYGGFNVPLEPGFAKSIAAWVRAGGIYVQANLRGGGEYGQEWYDQGRRENKQNVFDDFAACAQHLIDTKYTAANRIAIEGGSNGGLLTVATMIQYPQLFGAVISEVAVTDMFRFHVGSHYGYGWKCDYGDPGIKADFEAAAAYSPLHSVPEGFKHPPLLIAADANDDRVLPWHSYKMAATLQSREDENSVTVMRVRKGGGHSAGVTPTEKAKEIGEIHAFLTRALGPIDQNAYKATLKKGGNDNKPSKNDLAA